MGRVKWFITPAGALLLSIGIFLDEDNFLLMLLPAMLIHECGHILFLKLFGYEIRSVGIGAFGLEIDYTGYLEGLGGFASIAAGPLFGLVYGACCQNQSKEFWNISGGMSIALSLFNLLPVIPLDGGRLLMLIAGERGRNISRGISIAIFAIAAILSIAKGWISLLIMASWLLIYNLRNI